MEVEAGAVDITKYTLEILFQYGEALSKQAPPSIYMAPSLVRDLSPTSFTPRVVAIGPLHRQDEHLQEFQDHKTTYLYNWLSHLGLQVPKQTLRECVKKVSRSIERIKACYALPTRYDDSELAEMMVIDACFILEFIDNLPKWESSSSRTNVIITQSIIFDLLLIENQIPFFVIEIIWERTMLASGRMREGGSLTSHIKVLLNHYFFIEGNLEPIDVSSPDHILGFLHKYFVPVEPMPPVSKSVPLKNGHTAMELDRAGMNFKPNIKDQSSHWELAMKLEPSSWFQRPTLRLPTVNIGDNTEFIIRNLVVYEQSSDVKKYVTSYLFAMDMLIDTADDVALLEKSEVLHNLLGSNEEAAHMINNLSKMNLCQEFFYDQLWEEMNDYYNSYWPHTLAGLKRTYFNNPWSIIALFAAFLLFALTVVQTIFTIRGPV